MRQHMQVRLVGMEPMTLGEWCKHEERLLPTDADPEKPGFLIEHCPGGKERGPGALGAVSWLGAEFAGRVYRLMDGMTFGMAIEAMRQGYKVARKHWLPGIFLELTPERSIKIKHPRSAETHPEGETVTLSPYITLHVEGAAAIDPLWTPTPRDCLADDWDTVPAQE